MFCNRGHEYGWMVRSPAVYEFTGPSVLPLIVLKGARHVFDGNLIIPISLIVGFTVIMATVKILRQYERAVVFTLGRFQAVKGPGLMLMIPFIQEMVRVDLRIQVIEIRART